MLLVDLLVALFIGIAASMVLVWLFGWRHPARSESAPVAWFFVFFIIFLAAWAGGLWLHPAGPLLWGTYWIPPLVAGILIAFIIVAAAPARRPPAEDHSRQRPTFQGRHAEAEKRVNANVLFGGFFWILILTLIAAIFVAYALRT